MNATLNVTDMTCQACEQRIVNKLSRLEGIESVSANYVSNTVSIRYDSSRLALDAIKRLLHELHYPVVENKVNKTKQLFTSAVLLVIVITLYFVLERSGILYSFPMADQDTAFAMLFIIGVMTSVHCIAMCGGINISQCANAAKSSFVTQNILPSLLYNGGRVISYTIIGGIVGLIGSAITPSGSFRGIVAIFAGVFMLIMGLNMLGFFPNLRKLIPHLPKFISRKVDEGAVEKGPLIVGLLNGLMPCGPLQAMQFYALSTGSFTAGAMSMFIFSVGTVPLMFGLGTLSSYLSVKFTSVVMRVSAVLVILLALSMLSNGLSLSGYMPLY